MKKLALLTISFFLVSCKSINDDQGSYLRVSQGSYGAKLLQWVGLAANGEYCQISSNEMDYEWTSEDLEFFTTACGVDSERVEVIREFLAE